MENIEVSIILPTHNNESTIERSVLSAMNQDFDKPYELVVVFDSCTDRTIEIVNKIKEQYSNIVTFEVNNRSVMATRVDGLSHARGKYVMWLDGDDFYDKRMVSTLYNKLLKNDADLVTSSLTWEEKSGPHKEFFRKNRTYTRNQAIKAFLWDVTFRGFLTTKIFKKDLLLQVGIDKFPRSHYMYEDTIIDMKYLLLCNKVICTNDTLMHYNKMNGDSVTSKSHTRIQDNINAHAVLRMLVEEMNDPKLLKIFRNTYIRDRLNLIADFKLNIYDEGVSKKEIKKNAKKELKLVYGKKPLEFENHSYSEFIKLFKD